MSKPNEADKTQAKPEELPEAPRSWSGHDYSGVMSTPRRPEANPDFLKKLEKRMKERTNSKGK